MRAASLSGQNVLQGATTNLQQVNHAMLRPWALTNPLYSLRLQIVALNAWGLTKARTTSDVFEWS